VFYKQKIEGFSEMAPTPFNPLPINKSATTKTLEKMSVFYTKEKICLRPSPQ